MHMFAKRAHVLCSTYANLEPLPKCSQIGCLMKLSSFNSAECWSAMRWMFVPDTERSLALA